MASLIAGLFILAVALIAFFYFKSKQSSSAELASKAKDRDPDRFGDNRDYEKHLREFGFSSLMVKVSGVLAVLSFLVMASSAWVRVPTGHVSVPTIFGKVVDVTPYSEGLHFPVNPLYDWTEYDLRQKTAKFDDIGVPSKDQLISLFDLSIQFRLNGALAGEMKQNTGDANQVINVHMVPYFRSLVREQGKSVNNAEEFYREAVQQTMQENLKSGLASKVAEVGIEIDDVLIRRVDLPEFIAKAVEDKKKREQESEKQKAELKRFTTEQEQKVATAKAEFDAAKLNEQKIRLLADAEAYKIRKMNEQLARSPMYVELKKVEAWNGKLPVYAGGDNIPMIDLRPTSK